MSQRLERAAHRAVHDALGVRPDEQVLLVADGEWSPELVAPAPSRHAPRFRRTLKIRALARGGS